MNIHAFLSLQFPFLASLCPHRSLWTAACLPLCFCLSFQPRLSPHGSFPTPFESCFSAAEKHRLFSCYPKYEGSIMKSGLDSLSVFPHMPVLTFSPVICRMEVSPPAKVFHSLSPGRWWRSLSSLHPQLCPSFLFLKS